MFIVPAKSIVDIIVICLDSGENHLNVRLIGQLSWHGTLFRYGSSILCVFGSHNSIIPENMCAIL